MEKFIAARLWTDIILARIDTDENGEAEYVPPTDDEYDAVADIYDAMWETLQKGLWRNENSFLHSSFFCVLFHS